MLLAVIGPDWLPGQHASVNGHVADQPDDLFHVQLARALEDRRIRVIAVLVGGRQMPAAADLPADLADLAYCETLELNESQWEDAVERLVERIQYPPPSDVSTAMAAPRFDFWLTQAERSLSVGDLGAASDAIAQGLHIEPRSERLLALQAHLFALRREQEERYERARFVRIAIDRAQECLAAGAFEDAIRHAEHVLALDPGSDAAQSTVAQARSQLEERRRHLHMERAAAQIVAEARARFDSGQHEEAIRQLEAFSPVHPLVAQTLAELQRETQAIEARKRQNWERERHERQREEREQTERAERQRARAAEEERAAHAARERAAESGGLLQRIKRVQHWFKKGRSGTERGDERGAASASHAVPGPSQVLLGVSAPREVSVASPFVARFVAYVEEIELAVREQLAALDEPAVGSMHVALGLTPLGGGRWREGTPVTVRISGEHVRAEPPTQSFEWNGRKNLISFLVSVADDAPGRALEMCFEAFIEGISVAFIPLRVQIGPRTIEAQPTVRTAHPVSTAFASYASQDAPVVSLCLSALQHWDPQLDIFMDCLDLTPNDSWKRELERVIPARDAFLLFWSVNAMKSDCVAWELRTATSKKGLEYIRPMPIDDPSIAPPPEELKHLHFRDRYLLARQGFLRLQQPQR